jgi:hypothetical protein
MCVCVCVYIHIYIYIYTYIHAYIHTYIHTYIHRPIITYINTHTHEWIDILAQIHSSCVAKARTICIHIYVRYRINRLQPTQVSPRPVLPTLLQAHGKAKTPSVKKAQGTSSANIAFISRGAAHTAQGFFCNYGCDDSKSQDRGRACRKA